MRGQWMRRVAVWVAVAWLATILSAELLHAAIEAESHATHRDCPVCLFHATHGDVPHPEAVLKPVLRLVLVEANPLPLPLSFRLDSHPASHRSIRAPPVLA